MSGRTKTYSPVLSLISTAWQKWPEVWWCAGVVLLWRTALELLNQTIVPLMTLGPDAQGSLGISMKDLFLRWATAWDSSWYVGIVKGGYVERYHLHGVENIAFFPLFPLLVKILHVAFGLPILVAGFVLNGLLLWTATVLVYRLTLLIAEKHTAVKETVRPLLGKVAVAAFLLSPSAFFYAAFYADILLVALSTGAVYYALRRNYWLAATLAGLASATKSIGIVLAPMLVIIYLEDNWALIKSKPLQFLKGHTLKLIALGAVSLSGIIAYMVYLKVRFGDPIAFIHVEKYWGRQASGFFANSIWQIEYKHIISHGYFASRQDYLYSLLLMSIPIVVLLICIYLLVRYRFRYVWLVVLSILTVLIPISTGILLSLNRYILTLTPLLSVLVVHVYANNRMTRQVGNALIGLSATAMIVFTLAFLSFRFAG